ncbi:MAG: nucleotidyltransferase family protein [Acutalibacteraceae bacterium]
MKAVIMAGGEGTRLRPLTCTLPKPMARMCGTPVLLYILDLLVAAGFKEAILTLKYMPNSIIQYFNDDEYKGIKLEFVIEDEYLGTAGSVKNALAETSESVLVISGDAMCDYSLGEIIRTHEKNKADVTVVCTQVEDPREYGLVQIDENSFITGFLEKTGLEPGEQ